MTGFLTIAKVESHIHHFLEVLGCEEFSNQWIKMSSGVFSPPTGSRWWRGILCGGRHYHQCWNHWCWLDARHCQTYRSTWHASIKLCWTMLIRLYRSHKLDLCKEDKIFCIRCRKQSLFTHHNERNYFCWFMFEHQCLLDFWNHYALQPICEKEAFLGSL